MRRVQDDGQDTTERMNTVFLTEPSVRPGSHCSPSSVHGCSGTL